MKKYIIKNEDCNYIVGDTNDIKATFKAMRRAYDKGNTNLFPYFRNAKFSDFKSCYAIEIDGEGNFHVLSSDTMMALILDHGAEEVK